MGYWNHTVIEMMKDNGNAEPLYIVDHAGFRAVLPITRSLSSIQLPDRERKALLKMKRGKPISSSDYAKLAGISPRAAIMDLKHLESIGFVQCIGQGRSTRWVKN